MGYKLGCLEIGFAYKRKRKREEMRTHCLLWNFFVNYLISGFNFHITPFLFGDRTYHIIIYFVGNIYRLFSWSLRNILKYSDCKCLIWRLISKLELYFLVLFFFQERSTTVYTGTYTWSVIIIVIAIIITITLLFLLLLLLFHICQ